MNDQLVKFIIESNLINFTIALGFIVFFLIKIIPESTAKQKAELEKEIKAAEQAKLAAEQKVLELEQEIIKAKAESEAIIKNAKSSAEKIKSEILDRAKEEADKLQELSIQEIELQRDIAFEALRKDLAAKIFDLTLSTISSRSSQINGSIKTKMLKDLEEIKN